MSEPRPPRPGEHGLDYVDVSRPEPPIRTEPPAPAPEPSSRCLLGEIEGHSIDEVFIAFREVYGMGERKLHARRRTEEVLGWALQSAIDDGQTDHSELASLAVDALIALGWRVGPADGRLVEECERCQSCGSRYGTVYWLPDELWALVTPNPEKPNAGLLCPTCADRRALDEGITLRWTAEVLT